MRTMFSKSRTPRRSVAMLLGVTIAAASAVGVAIADDISNSVDGSIDAVAEVMPLSVGGANGSTTLYVTPQGGDGKSGCNLTGSTTLSVAISSSNTAAATVSPNSATFTSCGDVKTLTVTPHSAGTATISVSQTANTTVGTFNFAPATFTVNVTAPAPPPVPANTPPTIAVSGVDEGGSYNKGSVPVATCQVTDPEDGNSSFPATLSAITGTFASDGIGSQTASCSFTDGGGLTASSSVTYGIVDPTPPAISSLLNPLTPTGDNGWYTGNVTLAWTVSEPESPNSLTPTGCVDQSITTDQAATTYLCSASSAGGSTGPAEVTIKRDATAPTNILFGATVPADGGRYFPTTVPTGNDCTATDATSGLARCIVTGRSIAVGTHTLTATATDNAGNASTTTRTYNVRVLTVSGFFAPVDMGDVVNTVKNGSTVPLKFTVADEGVAQSTTSVVKTFTTRDVPCASFTSAADEIEIVSTGGTALRYDTTGLQFIQNWQTPKLVGKCYVATVAMIDGTAISANFKLK